MKVLCIGDSHLPAVHPGYLAFCRDTYEHHKCDTAVHIGDVVDHHGVSAHVKHPDADGPVQEYDAAIKCIQKWSRAFPKLLVCEGNHDQRVIRQAASVAIPSRFLRGYNDLWGTPSWTWLPNHTIDDVYYFHGTGCSGLYPAANAAQKLLMSVVMGHIHTAAGIWWRANPTRRIFGMSVGCGVDDRHLAFAYAENIKVRSILSCGVILDGVPQHIIMPCGRGERYHKSRFK